MSSLFNSTVSPFPEPSPDPDHSWRPFILNTLFPCLGVVLANIMSLSPLPTFLEMFKTRKLGATEPLPVVIMFPCAAHTFLYGVSVENPYLYVSNGPAVLIQGFCMLALFRTKDFDTKRANLATAIILGSLAILLINLGLLQIWKMSWALSLIGVTFNVYQYLFFCFPLVQLRHVLLSRSALSLVPALVLAVTVNGFIWTVYGLILQDWFIAGPNTIATVVGVLQIVLITFLGRGEERDYGGGGDTRGKYARVRRGSHDRSPNEDDDDDEGGQSEEA